MTTDEKTELELKILAHAQVILALLRRHGPQTFTRAEIETPGKLAVGLSGSGVTFAAEETVFNRMPEFREQHDG